VRIAKVPDRVLKMALGKYGEVRDIQEETWSRAYRYPVANGIRIAMATLVQHIPSHILVAGFRTLTSYEGQLTTCYGCNETGHLYQVCLQRKRVRELRKTTTTTSRADVAAKGTPKPHADTEDMELGRETANLANPEQQHADDNGPAPQRGGTPLTRERNDQTTEYMQVTVINEEDTGNATPTPPFQEPVVGDNMDGEEEEEEEVMDRAKAVEG
jgi:hypothetical protein